MKHLTHRIVPLFTFALVASLAGGASGCVCRDDSCGKGNSGGYVSGFTSWNDTMVKGDKSLAVAHVAGSALRVESRNGSIEVRKASPGVADVRITASFRARDDERLSAVKIIAERAATGELAVRAEWPGEGGKPLNNECASFVVEVPDATGVTLTTSNGGLCAVGLTGTATLTTSNGAVNIDAHNGPANVSTSNGAIKITDLAGPLTARTSNGSATVTLSDSNQGPATITSSNGSVNLTVGAAFKGTLTALTSNGRATVPVPSTSSKKTHATWIAGDGAASTLKTSNGSVQVKQR